MTKGEELSSGVLSRVDAEEPLFIIRGNDRFAIATIRFWIAAAEEAGVNPAKIAQAEKAIHNIIKWQAAHVAKTPD